MKPKPMQPKTKRDSGALVLAPIPKKDPTRMIYVRNDDMTRTGFLTHEQAVEFANGLVPPDCMGTRDRDEMRVRVSFRRRTGLYDVVVKLPQEVRIAAAEAIGE